MFEDLVEVNIQVMMHKEKTVWGLFNTCFLLLHDVHYYGVQDVKKMFTVKNYCDLYQALYSHSHTCRFQCHLCLSWGVETIWVWHRDVLPVNWSVDSKSAYTGMWLWSLNNRLNVCLKPYKCKSYTDKSTGGKEDNTSSIMGRSWNNMSTSTLCTRLQSQK